MNIPRNGSLVFVLLGAACSRPHDSAPGAAPPALLLPTTQEGLATVTLSPESERALGVEVATVERDSAPRSYVVGGEVVVSPGRDLALAAPTSGRIAPVGGALPRPGERVRAGQDLLALIPFATVDRDVRARATRELEAARAELGLADARVARAEKMATDHSGSLRNLDEAHAQQKLAAASLRAAETRLRTIEGGALDADVVLALQSPVDGIVRSVRASAGQSVPQGAPLLEIAGTGRWIRASFAASDGLAAWDARDVRATRVGSAEAVALVPVPSPPSADYPRGIVDRFFALPESAEWTPGERVIVEVHAPSSQSWLSVPFDSLIRDAEGGAWVYEETAPRSYRRRRVEPARREGDRVLLARGPAPGTRVVRGGAAELWGFELGADR